MTEDEIIDMAVTANLCPDRVNTRQANWITNTEELLHFAALVAQAEREACAKVCDEVQDIYGRYTFSARVSAEYSIKGLTCTQP